MVLVMDGVVVLLVLSGVGRRPDSSRLFFDSRTSEGDRHRRHWPRGIVVVVMVGRTRNRNGTTVEFVITGGRPIG